MARIGPGAGNSGDSYDSSAPPGRAAHLLYPRVPLRCTRGYILRLSEAEKRLCRKSYGHADERQSSQPYLLKGGFWYNAHEFLLAGENGNSSQVERVMLRAIPTIARAAYLVALGLRILVCAWITTTLAGAGIVRAQAPQGMIVAWGAGGENQSGNPHYGQSVVPAPNSGFIAVAAGQYHSLGLKADGSVVAWGYNASGQTNVPAPNADFIAVAAGNDHSLGLKADGSIVGWGSNGYGQTVVPVPNADFIAIGAGLYQSFGVRADGSVAAWGQNNAGQLNVPAPNTDFIAVAAGYEHSLGLKADGSIVAWGYNGYGQTNIPSPNTGFTAIAAGAFYNLGLKNDGSIVAWEHDVFGETDVPMPNTDFISIAAGIYHSLGVKADGSIVAWGYYGDGITDVPAPNSGFVAVAAGDLHSLAIRATGSCCDVNGADRGCRDNVPQADCGDADEAWTANASCTEVSCQCIPDCAGRECGDDGCGGNCGICDDGLFCNGVESCDPQDGCVVGAAPCDPDTERCNEATDECVSNTIPTVSEWGLMVLTLLLLTSAKLTFGRKSSPAT